MSHTWLSLLCVGRDGGSWRLLCPGGRGDAGASLRAIRTHIHAQKASQLLGPAACQLRRQRMYRDTWTFTQHMYNAWQVRWTVLRSTSRLDPTVVVYKKYIYFRITHLGPLLAGGCDVSWLVMFEQPLCVRYVSAWVYLHCYVSVCCISQNLQLIDTQKIEKEVCCFGILPEKKKTVIYF